MPMGMIAVNIIQNVITVASCSSTFDPLQHVFFHCGIGHHEGTFVQKIVA